MQRQLRTYYRLCLTTDPENAYVLTEPPYGYCRNNYVGYFDDLAAGRLSGPKIVKPGRGYNPAHFNTIVRALSVSEIPNQKTDVNITTVSSGWRLRQGKLSIGNSPMAITSGRAREVAASVVMSCSVSVYSPFSRRASRT